MTARRLVAKETLYERLADSLVSEAGAKRSTMMGFPCLRVGGGFFASHDHRTGDLIVKLPAERVAELVAGGVGQPFAPAGRAFREWVSLPHPDERLWAALMRDAMAFAGGA